MRKLVAGDIVYIKRWGDIVIGQPYTNPWPGFIETMEKIANDNHRKLTIRNVQICPNTGRTYYTMVEDRYYIHWWGEAFFEWYTGKDYQEFCKIVARCEEPCHGRCEINQCKLIKELLKI